MRDLGLVKFDEPFANLLTQGMVLNEIMFRKTETGRITYFNPADVEVLLDENNQRMTTNLRELRLRTLQCAEAVRFRDRVIARRFRRSSRCRRRGDRVGTRDRVAPRGLGFRDRILPRRGLGARDRIAPRRFGGRDRVSARDRILASDVTRRLLLHGNALLRRASSLRVCRRSDSGQRGECHQ